MELKDILLRKLDSLLNPKVENRLIIGFFTIGFLLVGTPTISSAFSLRYKDTTITAELSNSSDITMITLGVISLCVSLFLYYDRRKRETHNPSVTGNKDKNTIISILKNINTHVLDSAIERGRTAHFYYPVLHYYEGVNSLKNATSFIIYENRTKSLFNEFYNAFTKFQSHGAHFTTTVHPDLYRLLKPHEIKSHSQYEKNEKAYLDDVETFCEAYNAFISHIQNKYPDIDITETDKFSYNDYLKHYGEG